MSDQKIATLKSISRGFGGDSAIYESGDSEINVAVAWGLLGKCATSIYIKTGLVVSEFSVSLPGKTVQPADALSMLGYEVRGTVDFSGSVKPQEQSIAVALVVE